MEKMRNYLSLPHSLNLKNFSFFQFFILSFFQFFNFKNFSFSQFFNYFALRANESSSAPAWCYT